MIDSASSPSDAACRKAPRSKRADAADPASAIVSSAFAPNISLSRAGASAFMRSPLPALDQTAAESDVERDQIVDLRAAQLDQRLLGREQIAPGVEAFERGRSAFRLPLDGKARAQIGKESVRDRGG